MHNFTSEEAINNAKFLMFSEISGGARAPSAPMARRLWRRQLLFFFKDGITVVLGHHKFTHKRTDINFIYQMFVDAADGEVV